MKTALSLELENCRKCGAPLNLPLTYRAWGIACGATAVICWGLGVLTGLMLPFLLIGVR